MGEGGAQEVVWATGLGENVRAAMGELCPSKPGAGSQGPGVPSPSPVVCALLGKLQAGSPAGHRDAQSDPTPQGPPGPCS